MIIHIWLQNMFMCEKCERWKKLDDTKEIDENEKKKIWDNLEGKTKTRKKETYTLYEKPAFMERDKKWKR